MTNTFFYLFPVLFSVFGAFFGWIAVSVLVRKKPVVVQSNLVATLITATYIPLIGFQLSQFSDASPLGLWQFLSPLAFGFLLIFMVFILRGFSVYGFGSEDFRKLILASLDRLNVRTEEELGRLKLPDLDTDISISFQDRLGTGIVKSRDSKKFDVRTLRKTLVQVVEEQVVQVKNVTGYFYLAFAVIVLAFSSFFVWVILERLL